ncbi:uncharacterized protein BKA78DRAFT_99709 [Phyllosticta capitalensis]|uniref:uncharacterized protein n=1 Tax=Phyllosticta capitalensis TaxID=121624 RepID=UPI003130DFA8
MYDVFSGLQWPAKRPSYPVYNPCARNTSIFFQDDGHSVLTSTSIANVLKPSRSATTRLSCPIHAPPPPNPSSLPTATRAIRDASSSLSLAAPQLHAKCPSSLCSRPPVPLSSAPLTRPLHQQPLPVTWRYSPREGPRCLRRCAARSCVVPYVPFSGSLDATGNYQSSNKHLGRCDSTLKG